MGTGRHTRREMTDEQFLERWQFWQKALADDPHSLLSQLSDICWNVATYEAIRASWKTELSEDGDTLNVSPFLFHFITNGFSKGLCIDLRRLTEACRIEEVRRTGDDRSVYSLASILMDIEEHREAFTRRRLFLALKLEYDAESIGRKYDDFLAEKIRGGTKLWSVPKDLWDFPTIAAHKEWDRFSHCSPSERSPEDVIAPGYLLFLRNEVSRVRKAVEFVVNKYLAHASTPQSRESATNAFTEVTINQLQDLTVKCGQLVNTLSSILGGGTYPFLATAQWDKWEEWGRGWDVDTRALEEAWQAWGDRVERLQPLYPPAEKQKE